jgi:hypothetical protein
MNTGEAILGFSQCEKVKTGLIWISQTLDLLRGLEGAERLGAERAITSVVGMLFQEIRLAKGLTRDVTWEAAEKHMDQGMVMIQSGVASDAVTHFTMALSQVTDIGQECMSFLKEEGLL